jgi:hypothetical protein
MAFERIVVNRSATLYKTFYSGGVAMDPDSTPTVTITRDDGTLVTAGGVVDEAGTGTYSVTIPASENDQLDTLTVDWAAVVNTEPQEFIDTVEVAGGTLFTLAEARATRPLDNVSLYPEAAIVAMRNRVEQALEDVCEVAFVPRYYRETVTGNGTSTLSTRWPKIRAVRSVEGNYGTFNTELTADDLAGLVLSPAGAVWGYGWTFGYQWTIAYEHGHDRAPERVRRAALLLARSWLVSGPVDDRASTFNAGADGGTYSLVVPGRGGSYFGLPEVDATVQEYNLRLGVA